MTRGSPRAAAATRTSPGTDGSAPDGPADRPAPEHPSADSPSPDSAANLRRGVAIVVAVVALVAGTYNLGRATFGPRLGQDFTAYYVAGKLIRAGDAERMYGTQEEFQQQADRFGVTGPAAEGDRDGRIGGNDSVEPFLYPPVAAVLLLPVTLLPLGAAKVVFLLLNLVAQFAAIAILFADRAPPRRRVLTVAGWVLVLALFPFFWGLYLGQANSLVFLACALALRQARRGDQVGGGALIAVAALLKVFPVVLLGLLLLKRQYRAVAASVATMAVLSLLSLPVVGLATFRRFFTEVIPEITSRVEPFVRNQGISGTLHRLLTDNPYVRPLVDSPALARALGTALSLVAVVLVVWGTRRVALDRTAPRRFELEWGIWLAAAVLVSSISWEHYSVFLLFTWLPLGELLLSSDLRRRRNQVLLAVTAATFAIWAVLLQSGDEYDALPTGLALQPVVNAKFLATVALLACALVVVRTGRPEGVDRPVEPPGTGTPMPAPTPPRHEPVGAPA